LVFQHNLQICIDATPSDCGKKETAIKVVDAALKHFHRIDLLVNNAGTHLPKAFTDYTEDVALNGLIELAGPERAGLDELVRRFLGATWKEYQFLLCFEFV
jgi:NAD(P)-dependent dehydrogenase (short-subunit alcohol dehydrogenase family)